MIKLTEKGNKMYGEHDLKVMGTYIYLEEAADNYSLQTDKYYKVDLLLASSAVELKALVDMGLVEFIDYSENKDD